MSIITAIMVDGGFFLKRVPKIWGKKTPPDLAKILQSMCMAHLTTKAHDGDKKAELYRIFFYDCPPLSKKAHHPLTGAAIDFKQSPRSAWRLDFHNELRKIRKVALRLGYLDERNAKWGLDEAKTRGLCRGTTTVADLTEDDFRYDVRQKGVDMRIGLDIASVAFKKQANQIVLVSGDSDFVPAAKLARREGIDFVLDPMWAPIRDDLHEHIDGLKSTCPKPVRPVN
ncbi:putative uncharacterized protein [Burkholderiales bacterium GJ-E10]|nr:putative uncharacterized protein [Burkholderiales bacterium GJ-E10]